MAIRSLRVVRIMVAMLSLTMLVGLASPTSAQSEDPKDTCKKGGWETLTTAEGDAFKNQSDCVSYVAADGGAPAARPVLVLAHEGYTDEGVCTWTLTGLGFISPGPPFYYLYFYVDGAGPISGSGGGLAHFGTISPELGQPGSSLKVEAYAIPGDPDNPVAVSSLAPCPKGEDA